MGTDWFRGLKVGAKLGPIVFAMELGLSLLYTEVVLRSLGYEFHWEGTGSTVAYLMGDLIVITVVSIGIALSYAKLVPRLPGRDDRTRAVVLFVPAWSVYTVVSGVVLVTAFDQAFLPYYRGWFVFLCLMSIPYGVLMGLLWEREGPTEY